MNCNSNFLSRYKTSSTRGAMEEVLLLLKIFFDLPAVNVTDIAHGRKRPRQREGYRAPGDYLNLVSISNRVRSMECTIITGKSSGYNFTSHQLLSPIKHLMVIGQNQSKNRRIHLRARYGGILELPPEHPLHNWDKDEFDRYSMIRVNGGIAEYPDTHHHVIGLNHRQPEWNNIFCATRAKMPKRCLSISR
jgi:hypothetical protein